MLNSIATYAKELGWDFKIEANHPSEGICIIHLIGHSGHFMLPDIEMKERVILEKIDKFRESNAWHYWNDQKGKYEEKRQ